MSRSSNDVRCQLPTLKRHIPNGTLQKWWKQVSFTVYQPQKSNTDNIDDAIYLVCWSKYPHSIPLSLVPSFPLIVCGLQINVQYKMYKWPMLNVRSLDRPLFFFSFFFNLKYWLVFIISHDSLLVTHNVTMYERYR